MAGWPVVREMSCRPTSETRGDAEDGHKIPREDHLVPPEPSLSSCYSFRIDILGYAGLDKVKSGSEIALANPCHRQSASRRAGCAKEMARPSNQKCPSPYANHPALVSPSLSVRVLHYQQSPAALYYFSCSSLSTCQRNDNINTSDERKKEIKINRNE